MKRNKYSNLKIFGFPDKIKSFQEGKVTAPLYVRIKPINRCSHSCHWCCVGPTIVATTDGPKRIDQIKRGDTVYNPSGDHATVTEVGVRSVSNTLTVHSGGLAVEVTGEHPFLTARGWKNADDLEVGDYAVVRVRMRKNGGAETSQVRETSPASPNREPLHEVPVELPGDFSTLKSWNDFTAQGSDRGLFIDGIRLERGLELRRIDKIGEVCYGGWEGVQVYNFECEPGNAYEAEGFVVHNCTYSDGTKRKNDNPDQHLKSEMHAGMDERAIMPYAKMDELLHDLASIGTKAVTFSGGGEPLMYPQIVETMRLATSLGLDISIITNGQHLSGARAEALYAAKWVRVSIDYTSAEQMVASRHVPEKFYQGVLDNLRSFSTAKPSTCDLGINFIVTRENHDNLVPFARTLKDCGVENIRFSPVYLKDFVAYHAPIKAAVEEQLWQAQFLCGDNFSINTSYDIDSPSKKPVRPFSRCHYAETVPVVGADLGIFTCHDKAYDPSGQIGSIAHKSFKEVWFSPETARWFQDFNPSERCLHACANHSKVELFNELSDMSSDNFV